MPFTLSMYMYKFVQEKVQKSFEQKNKILGVKDIKRLNSDVSVEEMINVFKSAIVDHHPIDGFPYYLVPPLAPLFYHDGFKRCMIADSIGANVDQMNELCVDDAVSILDALKSTDNFGYVQIFAWHTLGKFITAKDDLVDQCQQDIMRAFGGSTASLLGGLLFIEKLLKINEQKAFDLLNEGGLLVKYNVQKALLLYFMTYYSVCDRIIKSDQMLDKNMAEFINESSGNKFVSVQYFENGAKEVGLIVRQQRKGVIHGTQQAEISNMMRQMARDYISAIGFFVKKYWS